MKAVTDVVQLNITSLSDRVDAAYGWPKDGVDIGPGIHVPAPQSRTNRHAQVIKHPTLAMWAYPVDGIDSSKLQPADKTLVDTAKLAADLTLDWFPTP